MKALGRTAKELLDELNETDETDRLEAKSIRFDTARSLLESVCSFESDRVGNTFTLRLLLRHFLNEADLCWLESCASFDLTDGQKMALVFLREVGAIDNNAYRQISGLDTLHASYELRGLRERNLIEQKGKGQRTYYRKGPAFPNWNSPNKDGSSPNKEDEIRRLCALAGKRCSGETMRHVLISLCEIRPFSAQELMRLLSRSSNTILPKLSALVKEKTLAYRYPAMPNHPDQAYMCKR